MSSTTTGRHHHGETEKQRKVRMPLQRRKSDGVWLINGSRRRYLQHVADLLPTMLGPVDLPADDRYPMLFAAPAEVVEMVALIVAGRVK